MKFTKLVHWTEINVLCTVNLQIFREIYVPVIKFKEYYLSNYITRYVIAWINEFFFKIPALNLRRTFNKFMCLKLCEMKN